MVFLFILGVILTRFHYIGEIIMAEEEKSRNQRKSGFVMENPQDLGERDFEDMLKEYMDNLDDEANPFLNPDGDLFASNDDGNGESTIEDYQNYIDDFKKNAGREFFLENEGRFWTIPKTRTFMGCLFEQTLLFWKSGEKDKAVDQLGYMLKLNPQDDQGARYVLLSYLLELNRLDDAQSLMMKYGDDCSTFWSFSELLLDIKKQEERGIIELEYGMCVECNKYVVSYLIGEKDIPNEDVGSYDAGDENEAIFYAQSSGNAWLNDENALKTLMELYK